MLTARPVIVQIMAADTPLAMLRASALPLADVGSVASHVDGLLMVVRAGVTQRPVLEQALALFEEQKVLGVVLNEVHP